MAKQKSDEVIWHSAKVARKQKESQNGHRSALLWFTGLSCAGKSTLANSVEEKLHQLGCKTIVLDGDNVRHGLCRDLRFSDEDRLENQRRVGEVSKIIVEAGLIVLAAFVSPLRLGREQVRNMMSPGVFFEIYCQCPLSVCEARDIKGFYKRARAGEIKGYTGIDAPYEEPENPELLIRTGEQSIQESVDTVIKFLKKQGIVH